MDGRKLSREVLEAYRLRALALRKEGYKVKEIAKIFGITYTSVSRWFVRERKYGEEALRRTKAKGADRKVTQEIETWLLKALRKPATAYGFDVPLWNSKMVQQLLKQEKGLSVSVGTVWRHLGAMGLSFQKPEKRYSEQNKEKVKAWLDTEWPALRDWVKTKQAILYFEDESGVSLSPVIGKTWAKKGETPLVSVTGKRAGILAMSAVSPSGKMRFRLENRRINSAIIIEFLRQIQRSHPNRHIAIVMDNAPAHRSKAVSDFVASQKKLRVDYIPPYSPELNPDEKVWRHLKHVALKNKFPEDKSHLSRLALSALHKLQKSPATIEKFFGVYN